MIRILRDKFLALVLLSLASSLAAAQDYDLQVTKTGPAQANAGSDVTYTITVSNNGPDASDPVTLTDAVPAGMTFVSLASDVNFVCTTPTVGQQTPPVNCVAQTLGVNASAVFTIVLHIDAAAAPGTQFTNVATISAAADNTDENNSSVVVTSTPPPPTADMGIVKTGPAKAGPNSDITYTILVTNGGPDAATNVSVNDNLAASTTFVSVTQSGFPLTCNVPGPTLTCTAASYPSGASTTLLLTVHVPTGTSGITVSNTATVTASSFDPNNENDSSNTLLAVSDADVGVTKTGPASANAGAQITYVITVTSNGADGAFNVHVLDDLPPATTLVSLTNSGGQAPSGCSVPAAGSAGLIDCSYGSLAPGATSQLTLVVNVGDTTSLTNTATVNSETYDNNGGNDSAAVVTTVTPNADLSVVKTGPASAVAGTDITYTITVNNAGPSTALNVSLSDTLPANTTIVSFTRTSGPAAGCTTAQPAVCSIASMAPNTQAVFSLVAHISGNATGSLTNTANVSATTADSVQGNNQSQLPTTLTSNADLAVTKTGPDSVVAGATAQYTISVTNNGPSTASTVSLTDAVPAGTTFVSTNQATGPAFSCVNPPAGGTGTVTCTIASLASGATASFVVVFNVLPATTGSIANTAIIASTTGDANSNNNASTKTTSVSSTADIVVGKTGPSSVNAGSTATYTLTVSSLGPSNAANVTLTDVLPPGTTFASLVQGTGPTFNCTNPGAGNNGTVTCTIASLAPSTPATFTLVVNVPLGTATPVTNTATVSTTSTDSNLTNNTSSVTTTVVSADVSVVKTGPSGAIAGSTITYSIAVANAGPSAAASVTLTDAVPANTTFASLTQGTGPLFTCTTPPAAGTGTVSCSIASLASSASATFTLVLNVLPAASGSIINVATLGTTTPDPNSANNTSTSTATIGVSADLAVIKTGPASVTTGTTATYSIVVSNAGPSPAATVSLTDVLPVNTTFVSLQQTGPLFSCTAPPAGSAGTVNCTIATLASGASTTFTLVVNVSPAASGTVVNTASVASATPDANNANNASTTTAAVGTAADLSITKTGPASVTAGQNATYTVTVGNAGPSSASSVTMTDVLPANTTFVSVTQNTGPSFTCTPPPVGGTGTLSCTIASLANGATATFSIVLNINPSATGTVANSAAVTSTTTDPTPANGAASSAAAAIALAQTDVSVTKTAAFDPNATTKTITYTILVQNLGPGFANNVIVNDVLPVGLTLVSAASSQGTCAGNPNVVCTLGSLASGSSATITLVATLGSTLTTAINTATVTTDNPDTSAANNSSTSYVQFAPKPIPALSSIALLLLGVLLASIAVIALGRRARRQG